MNNYKSRLDRLRGRQDSLNTVLSASLKEIEKKQDYLITIEEASTLIKKAALMTQQQLQFHIAEIATLALSSVFDDSYEVVINFEEKRNKTECNIMYRKGDVLLSPLDSSGYGAADLVSTALRFSLWSLKPERTRPMIIVDEPFRNLDKSKHEKASLVFQEISKSLGLQLIMVSHSDEIIAGADKVFEVTQKGGISEIREIN